MFNNQVTIIKKILNPKYETLNKSEYQNTNQTNNRLIKLQLYSDTGTLDIHVKSPL